MSGCLLFSRFYKIKVKSQQEECVQLCSFQRKANFTDLWKNYPSSGFILVTWVYLVLATALAQDPRDVLVSLLESCVKGSSQVS